MVRRSSFITIKPSMSCFVLFTLHMAPSHSVKIKSFTCTESIHLLVTDVNQWRKQTQTQKELASESKGMSATTAGLNYLESQKALKKIKPDRKQHIYKRSAILRPDIDMLKANLLS